MPYLKGRIHMIAALYARYSSDNQREESITAQFRYGRNYCQKHDLDIYKEYKDEAFTGTNTNRPAYQEMLVDAAAHKFDILIVHKPDRLGRNEFDYYSCRAKLDAQGIGLVFTGQQIDMTTPEGRLMENQLVGFAAFYSRNLAKEIRKGQLENVYAGKLTTRTAFGYKAAADKTIVIDETEAPAIRHIFTAVANGESYNSIVDWLRDNGWRTRAGNLFTKCSIHDILVNPRYVGTTVFGKVKRDAQGHRNGHTHELPPDCIIQEHAHEAIIDDELWARVQNMLKKRRHASGRFTAVQPYLLSGLVECGECGGAMTGTRVRGGYQGKYINRYYRCLRKQTLGAASGVCHNSYMNADKLEHFMTGRLTALIQSPKFIEAIIGKVQQYYADMTATAPGELDALVEHQKQLRKKLDNIYAALDLGALDDFDREHMSTIKDELRGVSARIAELKAKPKVQPLTPNRISDFVKNKFSEWLELSHPDHLQVLFTEMIDKIIITKETIRVRLRFALPFFSGSSGYPLGHHFEI